MQQCTRNDETHYVQIGNDSRGKSTYIKLFQGEFVEGFAALRLISDIDEHMSEQGILCRVPHAASARPWPPAPLLHHVSSPDDKPSRRRVDKLRASCVFAYLQ